MQFKHVLTQCGVSVVVTSYQAPNMNAFAERFVRSVKSECLDKMIFVGELSLRRALREYIAHYHGERPHQGMDNELLSRAEAARDGDIKTRERLGGLLNYYYREAA